MSPSRGSSDTTSTLKVPLSTSPPRPTGSRPIPVLPSSTSYSTFRNQHLLPNTPCLFPPSHTSAWAVFKRWVVPETGELDWDYLEAEYGGMEVDCVDCIAEEDDDGVREQEEVGEAVHRFADLLALWRERRGRRRYLKDWHLPLLVAQSAGSSATAGREKVREELYEVDECWLDDWMNEWEAGGRGKRGGAGQAEACGQGRKEDDFRFVYAGGGDSWTGLHRDVYCSYSISTNLFGRKLWYLFPPALTPLLKPLIVAAEREGRSVSCDWWSNEEKQVWHERGMMQIEQEAGETIFIPSGFFHSVSNLSHPTLSLNHNWANSHCLPAMYLSLCDEVGRARDAISDVKELLERRKGDMGEEGVRREWEVEVDALVERSEGWSFPSFFAMIHHSLQNLAIPSSVVVEKAAHSRWPAVQAEVRPPVKFVDEQLRPLVHHFHHLRAEQEWLWLPGLDEIVEGCEKELERLAETTQEGQKREKH